MNPLVSRLPAWKWAVILAKTGRARVPLGVVVITGDRAKVKIASNVALQAVEMALSGRYRLFMSELAAASELCSCNPTIPAVRFFEFLQGTECLTVGKVVHVNVGPPTEDAMAYLFDQQVSRPLREAALQRTKINKEKRNG